MNNELKIAILILGAGNSSRMGNKIKQLLTIKGKTLISCVIEQTLQINKAKVYCVLGAYFDQINAYIEQYPITIINNQNWSEGIGSSLSFGIKHIMSDDYNTDAVLIVLADQPDIDASYLNLLINTYKNENATIVSGQYNDKPGVPALFDKTLFNQLSALKGHKGAQALINSNKSAVYVQSEKRKTRDIDTLNDYRSFIDDKG